MTEDDVQRVRAVRERGLAKAREFFEDIPPEQLEAMRARAEACGDGGCPPIDREEIGAVYDANGWMPKADYLEMERIIAAFQAGIPIADDELETMLRFLREAREAIVRARVSAFLGELVRRDHQARPRRADRGRDRTIPEGPEDLDVLYWAFVREALDARPVVTSRAAGRDVTGRDPVRRARLRSGRRRRPSRRGGAGGRAASSGTRACRRGPTASASRVRTARPPRSARRALLQVRDTGVGGDHEVEVGGGQGRSPSGHWAGRPGR